MSRHRSEDTKVAFRRWSHKDLRLSVDLTGPRTQEENGAGIKWAQLEEA